MSKKKKNSVKKKSIQKSVIEPKHSFWTKPKWHYILLFFTSVILYANTLGHEYTQDDAIVIYDNMFTQEGVSGIPGILTKDTFFGFFKEAGKEKLVSGGRYRPMTLVMFAIEREIFGDKPFIGHLINILLYGFLSIMIYKLLFILFLGPEKSHINKEPLFIFILLASLFFTCHPIHTEAIANIKGRDEIMTMLGSIIALWSIFKYHYTQNFKWVIISFVSFFMALMSKENAITFLAVVPLAFILFAKNKKSKTSGLLKYLAPFVLATIIFLAIRFSILGLDFGGTPRELLNNPFLKIVGNKYVEFSTAEWLATNLFTLGKYLVLLIFPHPLCHDYYPRTIDIMQFSNWQVIVSLLTYIGLVITAFYNLKKDKIISFGIFFFLITLSIVSNIVFPIGTNMSERFIFIPSLGFTIILAHLLTKYINQRSIMLGIAAIIILAFSAKTITRNSVWKNDFTLFTSDVKINNKSAKLLNAAGGSLSSEASTMKDGPQRTEYLNQAVVYLKEAIKIHPTYKNAYLLLANSNFYLKNYKEAIKYYDQTLAYDPSFGDAKNNLSVALREGGRYMGQVEKNYTQAEEWLKRAIVNNDKDYESCRLLGITYGIRGNHNLAIPYFEKAIQLRPDVADNYTSMGTAYQQIGNIEKAREYYNKAVEINPSALNRLQNK